METNDLSPDMNDTRNPLAERCLAVAIIMAVAVFFICNTIIPETKQYKYDFACYYTTWHAVKNGLEFYDAEFGKKSGDSQHLSQVAEPE